MAPGAPRLVLASGSATRRALLVAAGLAFDVQPGAVDETAVKIRMQQAGADAADAALALAHAKAEDIADRQAVVIGADQILVCEAEWFDKPVDRVAARTALQRLRGRTHELMTAVTLWRDGRPVWQHVARPRLVMREFSDAFLDAYLAAEGDAVLGSVGAYRLEGLGMQLFTAVEGEHAAILGLPMLALLDACRQQGVTLA